MVTWAPVSPREENNWKLPPCADDAEKQMKRAWRAQYTHRHLRFQARSTAWRLALNGINDANLTPAPFAVKLHWKNLLCPLQREKETHHGRHGQPVPYRRSGKRTIHCFYPPSSFLPACGGLAALSDVSEILTPWYDSKLEAFYKHFPPTQLLPNAGQIQIGALFWYGRTLFDCVKVVLVLVWNLDLFKSHFLLKN